MAVSPNDLVIRLAHELAVSLEMYCEAAEMKHMWEEALDALVDAKQYLRENGLPTPGVVDQVLKVSEHTR